MSRCYTSRPPWLGADNRKLRPGRKKPAKKIPAKKPAILVKNPRQNPRPAKKTRDPRQLVYLFKIYTIFHTLHYCTYHKKCFENFEKVLSAIKNETMQVFF